MTCTRTMNVDGRVTFRGLDSAAQPVGVNPHMGMLLTGEGLIGHRLVLNGRGARYASFLAGVPIAPKLSQCSCFRFTPSGTSPIGSGLGVCITLGYDKEIAWRTCLAALSIARYGSQYFTMAARNSSNCANINFSWSANDNKTHPMK